MRTPSDDEIVVYVQGRYSKAMAQSVSDELERGGHFAEHIRWSFIREMGEPVR